MSETPNEHNVDQLIAALYGNAGNQVRGSGDALMKYLQGLYDEFAGLHKSEAFARGTTSQAMDQVLAIPRTVTAEQKSLGAQRTGSLLQSLATQGAAAASGAKTAAVNRASSTRERMQHDATSTRLRDQSRTADLDYSRNARSRQMDFTRDMTNSRIAQENARWQGKQNLARTEFERDRELKRLSWEQEKAEREIRKREEEEARRQAETFQREMSERRQAARGGGGRRGGGRGGGGSSEEKYINERLRSLAEEYKLNRDPKTGVFLNPKTGVRVSGTQAVRYLLSKYLPGLARYGLTADDLRSVMKDVGDSISWASKNYGSYAWKQSVNPRKQNPWTDRRNFRRR